MDDRQRFEEAIQHMWTAYTLITSVLEQLPLPVRLPESTSDWDVEAGLLAVDRARDLVNDMPLSVLVAGSIRHMLLDWLAAYELGALTTLAGIAPWRIDAIEFSILRIVATTEIVSQALSGNNPFPNE